jgi:glutamate dehydrogenase
MYFKVESVDTIANHIMALYGAKIFAYIKNENLLDIKLERETEEGAVYINTSRPGVSEISGPGHERRIDERYLDDCTPARAYRLETYRSLGTVSSANSTQLRCYFVGKCEFVKETLVGDEIYDIALTADKTFLSKATPHTLKTCASIIGKVLERTGPVIEMYEVEGKREKRLMIGYRHRSTKSFFSAV